MVDYCTTHNIDPFDPNVNKEAEFLAEYFHEGVSYLMVNTARSALSSVFPAKRRYTLWQATLCYKVIERYVQAKTISAMLHSDLRRSKSITVH